MFKTKRYYLIINIKKIIKKYYDICDINKYY